MSFPTRFQMRSLWTGVFSRSGYKRTVLYLDRTLWQSVATYQGLQTLCPVHVEGIDKQNLQQYRIAGSNMIIQGFSVQPPKRDWCISTDLHRDGSMQCCHRSLVVMQAIHCSSGIPITDLGRVPLGLSAMQCLPGGPTVKKLCTTIPAPYKLLNHANQMFIKLNKKSFQQFYFHV